MRIPVVPAPWEAEAGGAQVGALPGQFSDLATLCLQINNKKKGRDAAQCKDPGFSPEYLHHHHHITTTTEKKRRKREKKEKQK